MINQSKYAGRRLYRSQQNRMLGGVCGGLSEYFEIDATLVRIFWIAASLFGGFGILIYIAGLIVVPNNPDQIATERNENLIKDKSLFWGSLLIIVGGFMLFRQLGLLYGFQFWNIPWQGVWAVFLILVGVFLLYNRMQENQSGEISAGPVITKKVFRSRTQKMLGGVCGGLAEYFNIDVSLVRILWIAATIASAGIGILAYIVMMIVFPERSEDQNIQA